MIRRVRNLNASPHILNVVRRLTLEHWYIYPFEGETLDGSTDWDVLSQDEFWWGLTVGMGNAMQWESHPREREDIIFLISHLPRLEHLACRNCALDLESLSLVFHIPGLQTLYLLGHNDEEYGVPVANSSLRVFQYTPTSWSDKASAAQLFVSLLRQLDTASFSLDILTRIVANRKLPKPLPQLQRLSVFHGVHSEDSGDPEDSDASVIISNHQVDNLRKFLRIVPNLCELRIVSNIFPQNTIYHSRYCDTPSQNINSTCVDR